MKITRAQLRRIIVSETRRLQEYGADTHQMMIDQLSIASEALFRAQELAVAGAIDPSDARELEVLGNRLLAFTNKFD